MPESRKRKVEPKPEVENTNFNPKNSKFGKILLVVLCIGMVFAMLVAAIVEMVQRL